jgi:hypothetical protein
VLWKGLETNSFVTWLDERSIFIPTRVHVIEKSTRKEIARENRPLLFESVGEIGKDINGIKQLIVNEYFGMHVKIAAQQIGTRSFPRKNHERRWLFAML